MRSLLPPPPSQDGVPELRFWDDYEAALLRMDDDDWEDLKNVPGMSGDAEFDEEYRKFRERYHTTPDNSPWANRRGEEGEEEEIEYDLPFDDDDDDDEDDDE